MSTEAKIKQPSLSEIVVYLNAFDRNRRLLEAGEGLAEAAKQIDEAVEVCSRLDEANKEAMLDVNITVAEAIRLRATLAAYREAAKP